MFGLLLNHHLACLNGTIGINLFDDIDAFGCLVQLCSVDAVYNGADYSTFCLFTDVHILDASSNIYKYGEKIIGVLCLQIIHVIETAFQEVVVRLQFMCSNRYWTISTEGMTIVLRLPVGHAGKQEPSFYYVMGGVGLYVIGQSVRGIFIMYA